MPRFYINYGARVVTSGVDAEDRPKALGGDPVARCGSHRRVRLTGAPERRVGAEISHWSFAKSTRESFLRMELQKRLFDLNQPAKTMTPTESTDYVGHRTDNQAAICIVHDVGAVYFDQVRPGIFSGLPRLVVDKTQEYRFAKRETRFRG